MKRFNLVLQDLKSGQNIDLYVTVIAAIVLATLNILNVVPASSLIALNLTVLALISFTILGNRHKLDEIEHKLSGVTGQTIFLDEYPSDFVSNLDDAKELWMTGTHHSSAMTTYYHLFETKIKKGGHIKALLVDPNGAAYKMASMRFPGKVSPEQERTRILSSLETLSELKKIAPERVEIRVIDFLVEYNSYTLDPGKPQSIIYLERYTFKTSGGSRRPKFVYRRRDGRWFEHLNTEINELWQSGKVWSTDNKN